MKPTLEELASLYVLDQLDPDERAACESRLAGDPQFAALVGACEAELERHVHALPRQEPPADTWPRIEASIGRAPERASSPAGAGAPWRWVSFAGWGVAAVLAVTLGVIGSRNLWSPAAAGPHLVLVGLDARRSTSTELPLQEAPQTADARFIHLATLAEQLWAKPEELPVKPKAASPSGRGYALFDPGSNQGFIAIQRLPAIEPGKRYHLWLVDNASGRIREAGVIPLTGSAQGLYFFSLPAGDGARTEHPDFFVTAEDGTASGASRPRGKTVLGNERI